MTSPSPVSDGNVDSGPQAQPLLRFSLGPARPRTPSGFWKCVVPPPHWHPLHPLSEPGLPVLGAGEGRQLRPRGLLAALRPRRPRPPPCSSTWLLLKNPAFILLCLAGAAEATLITGMSTFGPKFLESQFSLSASDAATLFGETAPRASGPPLLRQSSDKRGP